MGNKQKAEAVKAAYEEGFDDGMEMYRSDFDICWENSQAKVIYDSLIAELEATNDQQAY